MREYDYQKLQAEQTALEGLIENTPKEAIVDRISLQSRLAKVQQRLEEVDANFLTKKAVITFRGKPVYKSQGISADFSGKAIESLNDMVSSVVASLNGKLNYMGVIPDREQHQLMVTGTAVGSFGFEFELPRPKDLFAHRNTAETALADIQKLFELALNGTDEDISSIVSDIHPRAVNKVSDFLGLLQRYESTFAMEYDNRLTRINTADQLNSIINRLANENIKEYTTSFQGEFQGFLPNSRTFEFKEVNGDIIKGKVGLDIEEPGIINRDYLYKQVSINLNAIQFGQAKPKFTLLSLENISS